MSRAIKLSDKLIEDAAIHGKALHRSPPKQIEHWATIGKIAEENPDLPMSFITSILIGLEDEKAGRISECKFE